MRSIVNYVVIPMSYYNSGILSIHQAPHLCYGTIPEIHPLTAPVILGHRRSTKEMT
jgi:hypothetical protein